VIWRKPRVGLEDVDSQEDLVVVLGIVCETIQGREVGVRWYLVVEDGVGSFKEVLFAVRQGSHATPNAESRDLFHPSVNIHVPHTS
jgi:hypothetical protein